MNEHTMHDGCGGTRDFKVRMGFGLHAGWAIEGAVGSLQKVGNWLFAVTR